MCNAESLILLGTCRWWDQVAAFSVPQVSNLCQVPPQNNTILLCGHGRSREDVLWMNICKFQTFRHVTHYRVSAFSAGTVLTCAGWHSARCQHLAHNDKYGWGFQSCRKKLELPISVTSVKSWESRSLSWLCKSQHKMCKWCLKKAGRQVEGVQKIMLSLKLNKMTSRNFPQS